MKKLVCLILGYYLLVLCCDEKYASEFPPATLFYIKTFLHFTLFAIMGSSILSELHKKKARSIKKKAFILWLFILGALYLSYLFGLYPYLLKLKVALLPVTDFISFSSFEIGIIWLVFILLFLSRVSTPENSLSDKKPPSISELLKNK